MSGGRSRRMARAAVESRGAGSALARARLFRHERRRRAARRGVFLLDMVAGATRRRRRDLLRRREAPRSAAVAGAALRRRGRGRRAGAAARRDAADDEVVHCRAARARTTGVAQVLRRLRGHALLFALAHCERFEGAPVEWVHESLSLDRFAHPIVRLMLPFRMPRRG